MYLIGSVLQHENLLGDYTTKVRREDVFKCTVWSESFHETSNDYGAWTVNFTLSTNLIIKSTMCWHHRTHKYACFWSADTQWDWSHSDKRQ